jgi:hypothetical protein
LRAFRNVKFPPLLRKLRRMRSKAAVTSATSSWGNGADGQSRLLQGADAGNQVRKRFCESVENKKTNPLPASTASKPGPSKNTIQAIEKRAALSKDFRTVRRTG